MTNDSEKSTELLIETLLNGKEIADRRNAAMALGNLKEEKAIEPMIQALGDHEDVAIFASLGLVKIGGAAVPYLRKSLKSFNEQIRGYSAEILGELEAHSALEDLIEVIEKDDSNWVKNSAVEAIGRLKSPHTVDLLTNLLKSKNNWIVVSSALALHRMGYSHGLADVLVDKLFTENEIERGITAWALVEICQKSDKAKIQKLAENTSDYHLETILNEIVRGISLK
jgi:HEAT repeat protein